MVHRSVLAVLLLAAAVAGWAAIGLVIGYFIFAKLGDGYVPVGVIFGESQDAVDWLAKGVLRIPEMREKILVSGVAGGVLGIFINLLSNGTPVEHTAGPATSTTPQKSQPEDEDQSNPEAQG